MDYINALHFAITCKKIYNVMDTNTLKFMYYANNKCADSLKNNINKFIIESNEKINIALAISIINNTSFHPTIKRLIISDIYLYELTRGFYFNIVRFESTSLEYNLDFKSIMMEKEYNPFKCYSEDSWTTTEHGNYGCYPKCYASFRNIYTCIGNYFNYNEYGKLPHIQTTLSTPIVTNIIGNIIDIRTVMLDEDSYTDDICDVYSITLFGIWLILNSDIVDKKKYMLMFVKKYYSCNRKYLLYNILKSIVKFIWKDIDFPLIVFNLVKEILDDSRLSYMHSNSINNTKNITDIIVKYQHDNVLIEEYCKIFGLIISKKKILDAYAWSKNIDLIDLCNDITRTDAIILRSSLLRNGIREGRDQKIAKLEKIYRIKKKKKNKILKWFSLKKSKHICIGNHRFDDFIDDWW